MILLFSEEFWEFSNILLENTGSPRRFIVTSPSSINVLKTSCSIIQTKGVKTKLTQEPVVEQSRQICRHVILYADDGFVYICWLYAIQSTFFGLCWFFLGGTFFSLSSVTYVQYVSSEYGEKKIFSVYLVKTLIMETHTVFILSACFFLTKCNKSVTDLIWSLTTTLEFWKLPYW